MKEKPVKEFNSSKQRETVELTQLKAMNKKMTGK